jgi:hypothetical protein
MASKIQSSIEDIHQVLPWSTLATNSTDLLLASSSNASLCYNSLHSYSLLSAATTQ